MKTTYILVFIKSIVILTLTYLMLRYLGRIVGLTLLIFSIIYLSYYVVQYFKNRRINIHEFRFNKGMKLSLSQNLFSFMSLIFNVGLLMITGLLVYMSEDVLSPPKNPYHYVHQKQLIRKKKKKKEYRPYHQDRKKRTNPYGHGRKKRY